MADQRQNSFSRAAGQGGGYGQSNRGLNAGSDMHGSSDAPYRVPPNRDGGGYHQGSYGANHYHGQSEHQPGAPRDRILSTGRNHRGKGPVNYTRSDSRIEEDLVDRLTHNRELDATSIEVRVENGEVTLNGNVADRSDKRLAEDLAEDVSGVRHVQNNLRIQRSGGQPLSMA